MKRINTFNIILSRHLLLFTAIFIVSCQTSKTSLTFLGKDPYKEPVYKEMLNLDKVKVSEVELAYEAYLTTHKIEAINQRWIKKQIKKLNKYADENGYYISPEIQYQNLMAFRNPTPSAEKTQLGISTFNATIISKTIPNPNSKGAWKNIGPFGDPTIKWSASGNGAINYVEMHPTNPAIMYACGRNAGLFRTKDFGLHWENLTAHFPAPYSYCVEVNYTDPKVIYYGANGKKIYYSSDEGETWEDRSNGINGQVYEIISDPTNADRVVAAVSTGIFFSIDAGLTWTLKIAGTFTGVDYKSDFSLILATKNDVDKTPKMFYTTDKGDTWKEHLIVTSPATVDRVYLALHTDPTGQDKIMAYLIDDSNAPTRFVGLWKSSYNPNPPAGQDSFNFTSVIHPTYAYPNGQVPLLFSENSPGYTAANDDPYGGVVPYSNDTWISDFWISPNDSLKMLTLREKMWGSEDGGVIWEYKTSYGEASWADNRYITMNHAKDTLFWCNDGGLWAIAENDLFPSAATVTASGLSKTRYMASKVKSKNGDLCLQEGTQMDVSKINKDVFMTGGQDLGQFFERAGRTTHVASADVYRGRIKPNDDKYFITGALNAKLTDGKTASIYDNIEADHGNPDRIYGFTNKIDGLNSVKLVRSPMGIDAWKVQNFKGEEVANTGGGSWTSSSENWEYVPLTGTGITTQKLNTFCQSKANPDFALIGNEVSKKLYYTQNLSSTNPIWLELPNSPSSSKYRIATHDIYEDIIAIATKTGVFISKNKGKDWFEKPNMPDLDISQIYLDKNENIGIYVRTPLTIYYHGEDKQQWQEFNKGLPLFETSDMRIGYYEDGDDRLYVSRYGSGVWSSPLQSVLNKNQNKPLADFKIHGTSSSLIKAGTSVKLIDLSLNADSLHWIIENGSEVITISNQKYPEVILNNIGYYKVTLSAFNNSGSDIEIKEQYINIYQTPVLSCILSPIPTTPLVWYVGLKNIKINNELLSISSLENYQDINKIFELQNQVPISLRLKNNNSPGNNFRWKIYLDLNCDGIFTINELIGDTNTPSDSLNTTFIVPATTKVNTPLHLRISGSGNNIEPNECGSGLNNNRQVIDVKVIVRSNVMITQTDEVLTLKSVRLSSNYNGGLNVTKGGFLLSTMQSDLNKDNSTIHSITTSNTNNGDFTKDIDNLLQNTTYYYKSFVVNEGHYTYSTLDSFTIFKKAAPQVEAVISLDLGNQELELQGMLFPNKASIISIAFMHGINDFVNVTSIDSSAINIDLKQYIKAKVNIPVGSSTYQFKIRVISDDDTLYSNVVNAKLNQSYCNPSVKDTVWFKRWSRITLNGTSYGTTSFNYENATNIKFNLETGKTYIGTVKHITSTWSNLTFYFYIDLNNDKDFDDMGELVGSALPNGQTTPFTISIPTRYDLRGRDLRMRVIGTETAVNPCTVSIGNVKDFTVHLDKCESIRTIAATDLPILDGKSFWASEMVKIQNSLDLADDMQFNLNAPSVNIEGNVHINPKAKIKVDGRGCVVE